MKGIFILLPILLITIKVNAQQLISKELMPIELNPKYPIISKKFPYLDSLDFFAISYLSDSLKVNGFLISPKKEGKYPGIIYNRGGNREFGAYNFKKIIGTGLAEIAASGYVIALSQYRGNGGSEGQEEFGGADVNDVLNLISAIGQIPAVDTSKLGMYGWSRGGMMTYQALIRTNKIKAVVVGGGSSDHYKTMKNRPGFEEEVYQELIPNYASNKDEELKKRSAIYWVDKFPKTVPILILHGGSDGNVRPKEALELSLELDKQRVPYKLIIYEGDNHGIANHRDQVQKEVKSWFNRYLYKKEQVPNMNYLISN